MKKVCKKCKKEFTPKSKEKICESCSNKKAKNVKKGAGIFGTLLSLCLIFFPWGRNK